MKRKVLVDIGGNTGQSINQFYNQIANAKDWAIYSFEPVEYDKLVSNCSKYNNVSCIRAAVGCRDERIKVYTPKSKRGQGCTTIFGKTTGRISYDTYLEVDSINIVDWFNDYINEDDFVIVKINIEGGEYDLMSALIKILDKIHCLYIKLHHNKFLQPQREPMLKKLEEFLKLSRDSKTNIHLDENEKLYNFKEMLQ